MSDSERRGGRERKKCKSLNPAIKKKAVFNFQQDFFLDFFPPKGNNLKMQIVMRILVKP